MTKKEISKKEVTDQGSEGTVSQLSQFAEETKAELAKVVWPSRQQLISESAAVMLMVILVATIISLVDKFFSWGAGKVFGG